MVGENQNNFHSPPLLPTATETHKTFHQREKMFSKWWLWVWALISNNTVNHHHRTGWWCSLCVGVCLYVKRDFLWFYNVLKNQYYLLQTSVSPCRFARNVSGSEIKGKSSLGSCFITKPGYHTRQCACVREHTHWHTHTLRKGLEKQPAGKKRDARTAQALSAFIRHTFGSLMIISFQLVFPALMPPGLPLPLPKRPNRSAIVPKASYAWTVPQSIILDTGRSRKLVLTISAGTADTGHFGHLRLPAPT